MIFFTKKSDFAVSQATALEEVALPAFLPCPPHSPCAATLVTSRALSCPRTFAHLVLSAGPLLASLPLNWFTFWVSAQMSLCQASLPGCSLHPELFCSIWYRYQYLSVCWIIN